MNFKLRLCTAVTAVLLAGNVLAHDLETEEQQLGYIIGMDIGKSLRDQGTVVDLDALLDALSTLYTGETPKLTTEEAQAIRESYIAKRQAAAKTESNAISDLNRTQGEAFLAENISKEGVQVTASGLQYKVITMGDGERPSSPADTVEVHYRGTLLDGTEFDSSYSRNETTSFQLDRVIAGWTEGLQLMPIGSKFEFYLKPDLAYGPGGGGPIPPNATLTFVVEMVSIGGAE
jgi:FKBP-type peptidyl-prolyl cis-trans isomerase FkpA